MNPEQVALDALEAAHAALCSLRSRHTRATLDARDKVNEALVTLKIAQQLRRLSGAPGL